MMTFFAILKDSYKEAVSGWVLPVMMALVFLFVVFVASMSFNQVTFQRDMESRANALTFQLLFSGSKSPPAVYTVENVRQRNDAEEPWKGDYVFDLVARYQTAEELKQAEKVDFPDPNFTNPLIVRELVVRTTPYLERDGVDVGPPATERVEDGGAVKPVARKPGPDEKLEQGQYQLRFKVETTGTTTKDKMSWQHTPEVLFGLVEVPIIMSQREWLFQLLSTLTNDIGAWVIMLIGVIVTSGFIPNMLRKGAIDLLIAKPIGRWALLLFRYVGGLVFVFLMVSFTILSIWLIVGIRFDHWNTNFLIMIPLLTFYFAILYAVSTLAAVLSRNTLVALMITLVAWGLFYVVGWGNDKYHQAVDRQQKAEARLRKAPKAGETDDERALDRFEDRGDASGPSALTKTAHYAHIVFPRTYDLDTHANLAIARGVLTEKELKQRKMDKDPPDSLGQTLVVSTIFIVLCLGIAGYVFSRRDG